MILVVDKGEITERGTHEELLARRGAYHRLFEAQYGAYEPTSCADLQKAVC
jgi:ATP-binding cassette subfamily B protein